MLKKVLVVDDSQAEIKLMQSFLQQGGFHSVGISDPTRIEETIEEERPNVILLDVVMPQRNGFQACRDLKNDRAVLANPGDSRHVEDDSERSLLGRATRREWLRFKALHAGRADQRGEEVCLMPSGSQTRGKTLDCRSSL